MEEEVLDGVYELMIGQAHATIIGGTREQNAHTFLMQLGVTL